MQNRKFDFAYNRKKYILWAWKGNYINLGAGAELGIYYGGGPHWKVDKNLAMLMYMVVRYKGKIIISYSTNTWWITGFNPNPQYLNAEANDLKVNYTVKFKNSGMYSAFKNRYGHTWGCNDKSMLTKYTF